jgi:hypothetical protein
MVAIKDNYFKAPDGNRYFRRNSPAMAIGKFGEKKEPATQANYLAAEGNIRYEFLDGKIMKSKPVDIDWARENKSDVEASAEKYFDLGGVTGGFSYEKAKEARLKLVRFHIDAGPLERVLNNEADTVRRELKKEGKDARVCTSAWVVMSGKLAERFETGVDLSVSGTTKEGLKITVNGDGRWGGSETITFYPGMVFAYGLHKVKKWNGDKVDQLEDDWQSLG